MQGVKYASGGGGAVGWAGGINGIPLQLLIFSPPTRPLSLLASFARDLTPAPCWLLAVTAALYSWA